MDKMHPPSCDPLTWSKVNFPNKSLNGSKKPAWVNSLLCSVQMCRLSSDHGKNRLDGIFVVDKIKRFSVTVLLKHAVRRPHPSCNWAPQWFKKTMGQNWAKRVVFKTKKKDKSYFTTLYFENLWSHMLIDWYLSRRPTNMNSLLTLIAH